VASVIHDDIELFLVSWYRAALAARTEAYAAGVEVDRVEFEPLPRRLVVIRDDGGVHTSLVTDERMLGISALAGTRETPKDALDLARLLRALAHTIPSPDPANPVAAVLRSTAPVLILEQQERARAYFTLTLSVVGRPL
jgi:hypothetical protein